MEHLQTNYRSPGKNGHSRLPYKQRRRNKEISSCSIVDNALMTFLAKDSDGESNYHESEISCPNRLNRVGLFDDESHECTEYGSDAAGWSGSPDVGMNPAVLLAKELTAVVLESQPSNINQFIADHLEKKLKLRNRTGLFLLIVLVDVY
jgi:hypothetical protein